MRSETLDTEKANINSKSGCGRSNGRKEFQFQVLLNEQSTLQNID